MKTSKYLIKEQKPVYADYHKFLFSVVNQKTEEVVFWFTTENKNL